MVIRSTCTSTTSRCVRFSFCSVSWPSCATKGGRTEVERQSSYPFGAAVVWVCVSCFFVDFFLMQPTFEDPVWPETPNTVRVHASLPDFVLFVGH